jgi:filamentous hemagglutinin
MTAQTPEEQMLAILDIVPANKVFKGVKRIEEATQQVTKTAKKGADAASDAASQLAKNAKIGKAFEEGALEAMGLPKNSKKVTEVLSDGTEVTTIFDAMNKEVGLVVEIKNVQKLSHSNQLRAQILHAQNNNQQYLLVVSPNTHVTGPLFNEIKDIGGKIQVFNPTTAKFTPYHP